MTPPKPEKPRGAVRRKRSADLADASSTVTPRRRTARATATVPAATDAPILDEQLTAAVLRFVRRYPNRTVELSPLAEELQVDPYRLQLLVERMGRRGLVVVPFIEPGSAGGATLTEKGLRWLIAREGGKPADVPVAFQPARDRVRAADEAARLPRAEVYGVRE